MFLRKIVGHLASKSIMPSQFIGGAIHPRKTQLGKITRVRKTIKLNQKTSIQFSEYTLKSKKHQRIIIHAEGNGATYQEFDENYLREANNFPDCKIVAFNFRGVRGSKGKAYSEDDWIDDVLALIHHYQKQGIKPENILLCGHSLGGAILTMAAAKYYQDQLKKAKEKGKSAKKVKSVKVFNNRSFSTLSIVVMNLFLGPIGSLLISGLILLLPFVFFLNYPALAALAVGYTVLGFAFEKLPSLILKPVLDLVLWLSFGTMDVLSAYKQLPANSFDHIVVKDDYVIPDVAGLHFSLKEIRQANKQGLKTKIAALNKKDRKKLLPLQDKLRALKDTKLRYREGAPSVIAHNIYLTELKTYHSFRHRKNHDKLPKQINGEKVFENKVRKLLNI